MSTKRKAASEPHGLNQKSSRVDPVSCQFCIKRKIKCNRVFPCSNCITHGEDAIAECRFTINSRLSTRPVPGNHQISNQSCSPCQATGLTCDLSYPCANCSSHDLQCSYASGSLLTQSEMDIDQAGTEVEQPRQDSDHPKPQNVLVSNKHCESCRQKRIKCDRTQFCQNCSIRGLHCRYAANAIFSTRPESAVGRNSELPVPERLHSVPEPPSALSHSEASRSLLPQEDQDASETADGLERIIMGHRFPTANTSTHPLTVSPSASNQVPLLRNSKSGSFAAVVRGEDIVSNANPLAVDLSSYLPTEEEAEEFFEFFYEHLSYQYHIIAYTPTKEKFAKIYHRLSEEADQDMSELALFFSIVASSLFFKVLASETADMAEKRSSEVAFLTGAALLQGDYLPRPTTPGLQAALIIGHHLSKATLSPLISPLFLHTNCVGQAVSLGLHVLDSRRASDQRRATGYDPIELELKRRLWWDIVTYDWLIGFLGGPQEFSFTIHPRQMMVNKPLNIEDEDMASETPAPLSTPTCMSYTLCRISLAEACSFLVDRLAPYHHLHRDPPYSMILQLDATLVAEYAKIPSFFRFDPASRLEHEQLYRDRPSFVLQRSFLEQGWEARICRLHRPWLIRGARDSRYSYSYMIALRSARKIIEAERVMGEDPTSLAPASSFFWPILHHVFIASVVLLIDVCWNRDDVLTEPRKQEVLDACRILSRAQEASPSAREGVHAMMAVMRKHWKHDSRLATLHGSNEGSISSGRAQPVSGGNNQANSDPLGLPSAGLMSNDPGALSPFPMEDAWIEMINYSQGTQVEAPNWENMLTDLGTSPS